MRETDNATAAQTVLETSLAAPAAVASVPPAHEAADTIPANAATGATADTATGAAHAADHPDRDLLDLVGEYHRLQAIEVAKGQIEDVRLKAMEQLIPPPPAEVFYREEDHTELGFPARPAKINGRGYTFALGEIGELRAKFLSDPTDATDTNDLAKARKRRLDEVADALQWWKVACDNTEEILGADIATREALVAMDARLDCGLKILVMEAVSAEGQCARTLVAKGLTDIHLINFDKIDRATQVALMEAAIHHFAAA